MMMSELDEVLDAGALSIAGTTTGLVVGDVKQIGSAKNATVNIGAGRPVWLCIAVVTALTSGGSATVNLQLVSDTAQNLTTSPTIHFQTGALAFDTGFTVGRRWAFQLPSEDYKMFLGVRQVIATAALTGGGVFDIFYTDDINVARKYADGQVD